MLSTYEAQYPEMEIRYGRELALDNKMLYAANRVEILANAWDGANVIGYVEPGKVIGKMDTWLKEDPAKGRGDWYIVLYPNTSVNGDRPYYINMGQARLGKKTLEEAGLSQEKTGGSILPLAGTLFSLYMASMTKNGAARFGWGLGAATGGAVLIKNLVKDIDLNPFG